MIKLCFSDKWHIAVSVPIVVIVALIITGLSIHFCCRIVKSESCAARMDKLNNAFIHIETVLHYIVTLCNFVKFWSKELVTWVKKQKVVIDVYDYISSKINNSEKMQIFKEDYKLCTAWCKTKISDLHLDRAFSWCAEVITSIKDYVTSPEVTTFLKEKYGLFVTWYKTKTSELSFDHVASFCAKVSIFIKVSLVPLIYKLWEKLKPFLVKLWRENLKPKERFDSVRDWYKRKRLVPRARKLIRALVRKISRQTLRNRAE